MNLYSVMVVIILILIGSQPCSSNLVVKPADSEYPQIRTFSESAFTYNKGQLSNPDVVFYSDNVYFLASSIVFRLVQQTSTMATQHDSSIVPEPDRIWSFRTTFLGANTIIPNGEGKLPFKTNCFFGTDPAKWRSGADNFEKVVYHDLYIGIDLEYRYFHGGLKYEFRISPGADLNNIKIKYEGAEVKSDGTSIFIKTPMGTITDQGLEAFQESGANRFAVKARIAVEQNIVSYEACYDHELPLTIDPFIYSTFLGGAQEDKGMSVALDKSGDRIVAGITSSPDFPTTLNGCSNVNNGNFDLFVTKLKPDGTGLLFSTFIGGLGDDLGAHMALDSNGNIVLAGTTYSRDFPVTPGAGPSNVSRSELYVLKLSPDGGNLLSSRLMGGIDIDACYDICLDSFDNIYLTGYTCSTDFPASEGAYDTSFNGGSDVFAMKMDSSGLSIEWSTFIGGDLEDAGKAIDVDILGQCYITGDTRSATFPVIEGYDSSFNGGGYDGFALKLAPAGDQLVYSTFIGAEKDDHPTSAKLSGRNNLIVAGYTDSAQFPTTSGACQRSLKGHIDCFVLELNSTGRAFLFSTYLGGYWDDYIDAMDLDKLDAILLTGRTLSSNYPVTDSNWSSYKEPETCFISKLNSNGSALLYSMFVGGGKGNAIFVSATNLVFLVGETPDAKFPVTSGAFDAVYNGQRDAFLVCIELPSAPFAPTNLICAPGNKEVRLDWSSPETGSYGNLTGYRIYRGASPSGLLKIADVNSSSYTDKGLTNGLQYYYSISAINEIGEGSRSTIKNAIPGTPPSQPRNLKISTDGNMAALKWEPPGNNGGFEIIRYEIYRGLSSSELQLANSTVDLKFEDTNVTPGRIYYYAVAAVNERGEGTPTKTSSILIENVDTDTFDTTGILVAIGILLLIAGGALVALKSLRSRRKRRDDKDRGP